MAQTVVKNVDTRAMVRDEGLAKFQANVLLLMGFGLVVTGVVGAIAVNSPAVLSHLVTTEDGKSSLSWLWWGLSIFELILVGVMAGWGVKNTESRTSFGTFLFYAGLNGLTIAPVMSLYTGGSILKVCLVSAITFGASALWGHTTKRPLAGLGTFLLMGLVGLIVLMVVNLFLQSSALDFVLICAGLLVFVGLTAYDMQRLTEMYDEGGNTAGLVVNGALALYLDFLNLLLIFLRLFGVPVGSSDD